MSGLLLKNISKIYPGGQQAIRDFSLEISEREFLILAGPEGCGKSTLIRMIAGLEEITDGTLFIDGKDMTNAEPKDRNVAMLFKNSVLYPNLNVQDNLAFALRMGKIPQNEIDRRVEETARMLRFSEYLDKMPKELTTALVYRVLLGRALVKYPEILLLDRTMADLEPEVQEMMYEEFRNIHEKMEMTVIYATDNQEAARALGTRMVVMNDGAICQDDVPKKIYDAPESRFVAEFISEPSMNIFPAAVFGKEQVGLSFQEGKVILPEEKGKSLERAGYLGKEVLLGIRPCHIHLLEHGRKDGDGCVEAELMDVEQKGSGVLLKFRIGDTDCVSMGNQMPVCGIGGMMLLSIDADQIHIFDRETEKTILNP